uniref:Uncharacterized protein n=1 Tax=Quercus lobata TaxID=97700 RepID=A0A7N2REW8_QUELO
MNKENVRKFLIEMLTQENLSRFGSNFCSLYAFPENYISKSKENVEKSLCLQYAAAAQWLIQSSIDILMLDESSFGLIGNPTSPLRALK